MSETTPTPCDVSQAQLREYARLDQLIEESEAAKAALRVQILDLAKAAKAAGRELTVESGELRVGVTLGEKRNTSYKDVLVRVEEKECFYLNSAGKPVPLGEMGKPNSELGKLVAKSTEMVPNDRISVKPNVPTQK